MPDPIPAETLTEGERCELDVSLADSGCYGFMGDHAELYAAVERIVARHTDHLRTSLATMDHFAERVAEREARLDAQSREADLRAGLRIEHWVTLAPEWGIGRNVPVCGRCTHGDGVSFRWPCPTLQLVGYPEPPELVDADMRDAVDALLGQEPTPGSTDPTEGERHG